MSPVKLPLRPCHLRDSDHRYVWEPTREEMAVSVTGVTNWGKDPDRFKGYESAAWRGTHVHRAMQALAIDSQIRNDEDNELSPEFLDEFLADDGYISPEGIDCSDWITRLHEMTLWDQVRVLACEFTMCDTRKSLGGQLDLLCEYKGKVLLVDLKTKSASYRGASKEDLDGYAKQAGGYLQLLQAGNGAQSPPFVDECRTLVVTPTETKWLPAMQPDACSLAWEESWGVYAAAALTTF